MRHWALILAGCALVGCVAAKPKLLESSPPAAPRPEEVGACYEAKMAAHIKYVESTRRHFEEEAAPPAPKEYPPDPPRCATLTLEEHRIAAKKFGDEIAHQGEERTRQSEEKRRARIAAAKPRAAKALQDWVTCLHKAVEVFSDSRDAANIVVIGAYGSCVAEESQVRFWSAQEGDAAEAYVSGLKEVFTPRLTAEVLARRSLRQKPQSVAPASF
jgi:hypothetical protein